MKNDTRISPFAGLRGRLFLLVLITFLPIVGLTLYQANENINKQRLSVLDESLRHAQNASLIYSQIIAEARQTLFILSQMPEFQQQDPEVCSKILKRVLEKSEYFLNFSATKLNGDMFASGIASAKPINYADREWFQRLVQTKTFVIGEYLIGRITGIPNIPFAYPVIDSTGQLRTILNVGVDLKRIGKKIVEIKLAKGANLTVIDSKGTFIHRFPDPEKLTGKSMPENPIVKAILTQKEGVQEGTGLDGVYSLYGFTTIGSGIEALHVSVSTTEQVAFAYIKQHKIRDVTVIGLISVLVFLGTWFFGKILIISPMNRLIDLTKQLADGDLTVRTNLSTDTSELGLLESHFDQMAVALRGREEERNGQRKSCGRAKSGSGASLKKDQTGWF